MYKSILKRTVSIITIIAVFATMFSLGIAASAETSAGSASITYSFSGTNASDAGYAEGVITLSSSSSGTYELYWADDEKALDDYYSLASLEFNSSGSKSVKMAYHTAIPANATKLIATKSSKKVSEADAVFSIPTEKQLSYDSGDLLYTFNSYSDVHIDCDGYYKMPNERLADAFEFGVKKNTDFIVSSGDMVTNAGGPDKEWKVYETILSESGYVNPVWEADGNHDMRCGIQSGLTSFIRATGTDSTKENYDKNLPYYYMFEKNSGDLFIFMALENGSSAGQNDEFSDAQLKWVTELIEQNYKSGINIYIVEHAPIHRFGAGDNMDAPYYSGLLRESYPSTVQFKNILIKYKNLIFLSGHTHEDFEMGYNYSNEDGDACHMIHNPSVAGTTKPKENEHSLEYNDGWGFNSQGYYVEAYQKRVVFYGANLEDKNIYPQYCYIMEGSRAKAEINSSTSVNELSGNTVSITDKLTEASDILGAYYTYASYDQYQAVKKLYYQFKNETTADESVAADFDRKIADLKDIGEHTGMPKTYPVGKKYYFENTKSWSKVYAYAWTGKTHNAEWPGVQISSKETLNGKEIYSVEFDTAGQYRNLIFTNGSSQTVDIPLDQYKYNAFRLAGKDSNGKYYVENFDRESGTVSESNTYALLYYVESEHDWSDTSTLFTQKEDGTYQCAYTANKTCNMSCSLYDKTNKVYKSLTASQGVDYDRGTTFNFTLSSMSSRGKSITVRSVPKGETLYINYTPSTENITVSCGAPKAEPNGDMTICEGTSRDTNIPYRSSSNNEETGTEQIYKSDMLTGLKDKKLCSMALYSSDEIEVDVKGMQIYLAEVDFSTMPNGWVDIPANAIKVFDGDYNFAGGKNIIEFKTPFEYKGGNLLVVIQNSAQGVCNEAKEFIGINTETTGVSCYRIGSSNASSASYDTNTSSFLAKCSFEFVDEHLYTVTWNNFDGTLLEKDENLTYGTTPTYDGETPIRQSDDEFTYTFSGWTPEVTKVTCDITYTAKFDQTPINDTDTTTDSEELSDTDTTTDSEELSDTDTTTDSEELSDTDTATDSEEVSDTDTAADSEEVSDTDTTTDSEEVSDTDTTTDSEELSDTDTTTDSEE
ncbi:MAG: starch-binding protein, partial [Clostridia bacterium]|nr:starch-binding protein [Clostridia bacterium]